MKPVIFYYQIALGILFTLVYGLFYRLELKAAWRPWLEPKFLRIKRAVGLFLVSRWAIWLVFPSVVWGFAIVFQQNPMGLLYQLQWPDSVQVILGVFALDLVMYVQHRAAHYVPWIWRVHRVHHMDLMLDTSTALRFHPLDGLFMVGSKILGVAFFGILPLSVFIYQILLGCFLFFAHMNVRLAIKTDAKWRVLFVTPHMHRLHHSDEPNEHNRNYGFCFSFWDKIFGSYKAYPETGVDKIVLGLRDYRAPKFQTLKNMLIIPFNPAALKVRLQKPPVTKMRVASPDKETAKTPKKVRKSLLSAR